MNIFIYELQYRYASIYYLAGLISYASLKDTNKFLLVPLMGEPTSINAEKVKNIILKSFGNELMAES